MNKQIQCICNLLLAQRLFPVHYLLVQLDQDDCPLGERIGGHGMCGDAGRLCDLWIELDPMQ